MMYLRRETKKFWNIERVGNKTDEEKQVINALFKRLKKTDSEEWEETKKYDETVLRQKGWPKSGSSNLLNYGWEGFSTSLDGNFSVSMHKGELNGFPDLYQLVVQENSKEILKTGTYLNEHGSRRIKPLYERVSRDFDERNLRKVKRTESLERLTELLK